MDLIAPIFLPPGAIRIRRALAGRRHLGVNIGGPFDRASYELARSAVNGELVYEVPLGGSKFIANQPCSLAVTGAAVESSIGPSPILRSIQKGDEIEFSAPRCGLRYYVAAGSEADFTTRLSHFSEPKMIRVLGLAEPQEVVVSSRQDRRGVLVSGSTLKPGEKMSEPVQVGLIQIVADGQLILLGPDGPTIGGYSTAGCVIDADLDMVGQLRPGLTLKLVPTS